MKHYKQHEAVKAIRKLCLESLEENDAKLLLDMLVAATEESMVTKIKGTDIHGEQFLVIITPPKPKQLAATKLIEFEKGKLKNI